MNILITGCGFIGHWLAFKLQHDHSVTVIDTNAIPEWRMKHLEGVKRFVRGKAGFTTWEESFDVVIYTSSTANAKEAIWHPFTASESMVDSPIGLIQDRLLGYPKHFIYLSSSMVYGDFNGVPDENHPLNPTGPYGFLKRTGEEMVRYYCEACNIPYTIIRPSAVYGPRDHLARVISCFIYNATRNTPLKVHGNNAIDFTYIEDLVDGILSIVMNEKAFGETFNMTRGEAVPLFDAATHVVKIMGQSGIDLEDHDPNYPIRGALDISKARDLLGYNPPTDYKTGIEKYIEWWMNDEDWDSEFRK